MPVLFAAARSCGMPGIRRSCRAPSSTTRTFGPSSLLATDSAAAPPKPPPAASAGTFASRAVTSATSSDTRFDADSRSVPTSATQSSLPRGTQCGSQRTQFQCGPAAGSAPSTTMDRSRGLCRTADCATSQRASARDASTGPARPRTPVVVSRIETGTQNAVGTAGGEKDLRRVHCILTAPLLVGGPGLLQLGLDLGHLPGVRAHLAMV